MFAAPLMSVKLPPTRSLPSGVARTAPLMYLMPPVAGLVAWFATGESYTGIKLAGAALTLAGVAVAQFAHRPRDPLPEGVTVVD